MRKTSLAALLAMLAAGAGVAKSQEADAGFDLRATLTGQSLASSELTEAPRSGSPMIAAFRGVAYPTLKINGNWTITGAYQLATRPYFYEDLSSAGDGANGTLLQLSLNYARVSGKGSIQFRAGELSTAFGSFPLRYDDAENPLVDLPPEYGYYYSPVSFLPVAGAQLDATRGKWDARVQFANSSPVNPRSLFDRDQYGNWAAGLGYTIRQGFRAGVSGFHGPYLDRQYQYFYPGEANPNTLPAQGLGFDAAWAHGHTTLLGEVQQFVMPYRAIPPLHERAGYGELRQVLTPRWYVAARPGLTKNNFAGQTLTVESAVGFRPNRFQLIKMSYEVEHYAAGAQRYDNTFGAQLVTSLHFSRGRE